MLTLKTSDIVTGSTLAMLGLLARPALADGMAHGRMDWLAPLDHYCERVAAGLWNEPLNVTSNLAFLIAAGVILAQRHRAAWADQGLVVLAVLGGIVGLGSILFHIFANGWSLLADMIPIAVFIYAFVFVALRRFLGAGALGAGLGTMGLYLLSPWLEALLRPILGASAAYAPGLVATFGVAAAAPALRRGPAPPLLLAAGLAFAVALIFRLLDQPLCGSWPAGTHFLWHLFNGLSIGLALLAAERVGPAGKASSPGPRLGPRREPGHPGSRAADPTWTIGWPSPGGTYLTPLSGHGGPQLSRRTRRDT